MWSALSDRMWRSSTSQRLRSPLRPSCCCRTWTWSVPGASFWTWSSPPSSVLVWTGCRQSPSLRRSPADSTCESLWSTSGWKQKKEIDGVSVTNHRFLNFHNGSCSFMFKKAEISQVVMRRNKTTWAWLTWGTCDQFLSPHYMECDALRLVCLSTSGCLRSPSCHHLTWTSCQSRLRGQELHVTVCCWTENVPQCQAPLQPPVSYSSSSPMLKTGFTPR